MYKYKVGEYIKKRKIWLVYPVFLFLITSCAAQTHNIEPDITPGKYDSLINSLKKRLEANPYDSKARINLGKIYFKLNKFLEAKTEFQESVKNNPGNTEAHYSLGIIYAKLNEFPEAITEFKEALRIEPFHAKIRMALAKTYYLTGKYSEAQEIFQEAIRIDPNDATARQGLGAVYGKLGRRSESIDELRESIRLKPDNAKAHHDLGLTYGLDGMNSEAMSEFKEAIRINPGYAEAHHKLGVVYTRYGMYSEAMSEFKEAIRINPGYAEAYMAIEKINSENLMNLKSDTRISESKRVMPVIENIDVVPQKIEDYQRQNSFALVLGISNYRDEIIPKVKYAKSDAEVVAAYLENVGGIPHRNIKLLTDENVTRADLEAYIEDWLPRRVKKESEVFIYFAGHGTPDPVSREAYIVPYDGHPDFKSKLYPLKKMYASLNKLPAEQVIVMLDSCFSGAGGRSIIAEGSRPITLSIENPVLSGGKIAVLAASTGSQISSDYDRVKHGLFTYYLLKGMKGEADNNKDGKVLLGELYNYIKENVSKTASIELNRDQTPMLLPGLNQNGHGKIEITRVR